MDLHYPAFGTIVIDGTTYDHDVVIANGVVRARDKGPSRPLKGRFGHTPLSLEEDLPWSQPRLVIGTGYSGRLPLMEQVHQHADHHGAQLMGTDGTALHGRCLDALLPNHPAMESLPMMCARVSHGRFDMSSAVEPTNRPVMAQRRAPDGSERDSPPAG